MRGRAFQYILLLFCVHSPWDTLDNCNSSHKSGGGAVSRTQLFSSRRHTEKCSLIISWSFFLSRYSWKSSGLMCISRMCVRADSGQCCGYALSSKLQKQTTKESCVLHMLPIVRSTTMPWLYFSLLRFLVKDKEWWVSSCVIETSVLNSNFTVVVEEISLFCVILFSMFFQVFF